MNADFAVNNCGKNTISLTAAFAFQPNARLTGANLLPAKTVRFCRDRGAGTAAKRTLYPYFQRPCDEL